MYSDVRVISFDKKFVTILYPNPVQSNTVFSVYAGRLPGAYSA